MNDLEIQKYIEDNCRNIEGGEMMDEQAFYEGAKWYRDNVVNKLPIHGVMGSFIKELNWIDKPKKKASDIYKVMADAEVPMPHTVGNAHIEITEQTYPCNYYEATLWCFNRGTNVAEGNSIIECKKKAFEWWSNFVCGFLNCP